MSKQKETLRLIVGIVFFGTFLWVPVNSFSQAHQIWFRLNWSHSFTETQSIYVESDLRPFVANFHLSQSMFRGGYALKLTDKWTAGMSFSRFQTYWDAVNIHPESSWEYRLQQDIDWKHNWINGFQMNLHGRLDERFFQTHTALRTRFHLVLEKKLKTHAVGLNTEYHYQFNLSTGNQSFNQFREELFFSQNLEKGVFKGIRYGAMYQYVPSGNRYLNNLVLRFTVLLH